jgi:hypothetical protein
MKNQQREHDTAWCCGTPKRNLACAVADAAAVLSAVLQTLIANRSLKSDHNKQTGRSS